MPYFSKKVRIRVFCALILGLQEMMVQPNSSLMFFRLCLPASVMGKLSSTLNRMGFMRMTSLSIYTWKWLSLPPETATAQSYPPGPLQPRYLSHMASNSFQRASQSTSLRWA